MPKHCETHMDMRVYKSGQENFVLKINNYGMLASVRYCLWQFASKYNCIIFDDYSLNLWILFIHSVDLTVDENIISQVIKESMENIFKDFIHTFFAQKGKFFYESLFFLFRKIEHRIGPTNARSYTHVIQRLKINNKCKLNQQT